eukprot:sb/3477472/
MDRGQVVFRSVLGSLKKFSSYTAFPQSLLSRYTQSGACCAQVLFTRKYWIVCCKIVRTELRSEKSFHKRCKSSAKDAVVTPRAARALWVKRLSKVCVKSDFLKLSPPG